LTKFNPFHTKDRGNILSTKIKAIYLLSVFLLVGVYSFATQVFPQSLPCNTIRHFLFDKFPKEGFCAGTFIKTPSGNQLIEDLQVGDMVLDMYGNSTEIIAITRRYVDGYIRIFLEDIILCMGSDQLIYSSQDSLWIKARDVLINTEYVDDPTTIYALTVQNHTLSVSPCDFYAHNSVAIFSSTSSVCCGYVAVINPIIAMLGGTTLALALVAYNAYQEYLEKSKDENLCLHNLPDTVVLAERFYYEQRKVALEKIKQELMAVKKDLQIIKGLYSGCFTHQLLQLHMYNMIKHVQPLSIDQEKQLFVDQKNTLRALREAELVFLESRYATYSFC
jgi:Tfp pilus assembly protein PilE